MILCLNNAILDPGNFDTPPRIHYTHKVIPTRHVIKGKHIPLNLVFGDTTCFILYKKFASKVSDWDGSEQEGGNGGIRHHYTLLSFKK